MKTTQFIACSIIILILGAISFSQWQKNDELNRQIARMQTEAAALAASAKEDMANLQKKVEDRTQVIAEMEAARKDIARGEPVVKDEASAEAPTGKSAKLDLGGMMKKMFTDPNMKKMMKGMQSMGVKMMYADLAKELGLTPDQANQVMELLGDRQMALTTKGMKMFGGDSENGAAKDDGREVAAADEDYDAHLESILGKDGMAKLKDYERTAGDRMMIQQYQQAFTANGMPLDENESQGLLNIMKEERMKQPPSPLDPGTKDFGAAIEAMQSEEKVSKLLAAQEDANRRVNIRARNVLAPDKMVQFEKIQQQQLDMQKMGIEMGAKMFNQK